MQSSSEECDTESYESFDDGYDENLMGSDDDKNRLQTLTEREREMELFERFQRRERLKTVFEIRRKLRHQGRLETERNKHVSDRTIEKKPSLDNVSIPSRRKYLNEDNDAENNVGNDALLVIDRNVSTNANSIPSRSTYVPEENTNKIIIDKEAENVICSKPTSTVRIKLIPFDGACLNKESNSKKIIDNETIGKKSIVDRYNSIFFGGVQVHSSGENDCETNNDTGACVLQDIRPTCTYEDSIPIHRTYLYQGKTLRSDNSYQQELKSKTRLRNQKQKETEQKITHSKRVSKPPTGKHITDFHQQELSASNVPQDDECAIVFEGKTCQKNAAEQKTYGQRLSDEKYHQPQVIRVKPYEPIVEDEDCSIIFEGQVFQKHAKKLRRTSKTLNVNKATQTSDIQVVDLYDNDGNSKTLI